MLQVTFRVVEILLPDIEGVSVRLPLGATVALAGDMEIEETVITDTLAVAYLLLSA